MLDLEQPCRVIRRGDAWVFGPQQPYERVGDIGDVVFPCGVTHNPESGEIRMYDGAAATCLALATGNVNDLLDWLKNASGHS